jgi:hypothetical protein
MDICSCGHEATCISQDFTVTYLSGCSNCFAFSHVSTGGTESTSFMSKVVLLSSLSTAETIEEVFSISSKDQFALQTCKIHPEFSPKFAVC